MFADVVQGDARSVGVEAAGLATERLEAEIRELGAHIAAATCRWLLLVAEYDRREGWTSWECLSCAHWVSWMCGISLTTAHEHLRVARAIEALPLVRSEFAAGVLSYSKVRAITRVATPDTEVDLVELGRTLTASQLDRTLAGYAKAQRNAEPQPEIERKVSWVWDDDGSLVARLRMGADEGALFVAAINREVDAELQRQREAAEVGAGLEAPRSLGELRADAVMAVVRSALDAPADAAEGFVVPEVVVHVEADTDGTTSAQVEGGPVLHPAAAKRLGCDANVQVMIERDGDPLHVGRRTRKINRRLRRAVLHRTGGLCAFPGCASRARHIHHLWHWTDGGPTDIENLAPLCWRHHHAVHEGGWTLARAPGGYSAVRPPTTNPPAGPGVLVSVPDPTPAHPHIDQHPDQPDTITPDTPVPSWAGEPFELAWVVGVLCDRTYVTHQLATENDERSLCA
jgi:hypothetical protein